MIEIAPVSREAAPQLVKIWNATLGDRFPLTERLLGQTLFHDPFFEPEGLLAARDNGQIVGWALCKTMGNAGSQIESFRLRGGIGALCVRPDFQRRGIASQLLLAAEAHLSAAGSTLTTLYFPHHLLPGVPADDQDAVSFFKKRGYSGRECYDLWRDLRDYEVPDKVHAAMQRNPGVEIRPARAGEGDALCDFVAREFPGAWTYTTRRHFAHGDRPEDFIIVVEAGEIIGFCHTADFRSTWLMPHIYWHKLLGDKYGGLGPIGMAAAHRKRGLGLALCAFSVDDLKRRGVTQMTIDWTGLLDFYGQLGFTIWRRFWQGHKET